jgi:hypothetical protein
MFKYFGIALVCLAIALAFIPRMTDCQSQGDYATLANGTSISMRCHWTATAQTAVAIPTALVGLAIAIPRRKNYLWVPSLMGVALGIMPILLATALIGTCSDPTHICNTLMKPLTFVLGGFISMTSAASFFFAYRSRNNVYVFYNTPKY